MSLEVECLEHACEILRAHGMNVYVQGTEVVVYAASTNRWQEVTRIRPARDANAASVATCIAHKIADLTTGPHSHD